MGAGESTDGDIICGCVVLVRRRGRRECRERRVVRCRAHDEHVEALYLPVVENDANVRWWRRVHLYSCQEWYGVTSHRWAVASRRGPRALCDAPVAQPRWRQAVQTPWTLYAFRFVKALRKPDDLVVLKYNMGVSFYETVLVVYFKSEIFVS